MRHELSRSAGDADEGTDTPHPPGSAPHVNQFIDLDVVTSPDSVGPFGAGSARPRDFVAVGAILRRGLTDAQVAQARQVVVPEMTGAAEYMRAILRRARALLAQGPRRPHDSRKAKPPRP